MNEKLKPCPLCGGGAKVVAYYINGTANRLNYFVQCEENKCHRTRHRRKSANAVADWENEIFNRQHEEWMKRKRDKVKQAFIDCEKFIGEHTPEELREYEKSLNLDYESYYKTPKRHTDRKGEEMSEFNYFREKRRMIEGLGGLNGDITCGTACKECLLSSCKNEYRLGCLVFEMLHPDEATKIVRKWAEKHPRKTRKDILLEKFPNAKVSRTGRARICAYALGLVSEEEYHKKCCEYPTAYCTDCWNTEVEE